MCCFCKKKKNSFIKLFNKFLVFDLKSSICLISTLQIIHCSLYLIYLFFIAEIYHFIIFVLITLFFLYSAFMGFRAYDR